MVTIPGRTSLRFADARMTVVDNARYEPEQILLLTSSSPVAERAFAGKIAVQLLPVRHPRQPKEDKRPYALGRRKPDRQTTSSPSAEPVSLSYVPSDEGGNTSHGFKFLAPVGRYLYVTVKDGVQGTGGYISGKPFVATVRVEPYQQALTFLGQGALLSLSGDRKVGFLVRDVDKVQVEIGRVLPNQLQHLAPQMWDFSRPALYWKSGRQAGRALRHDARLQRQGARQADLRQHRRRSVSAGQDAVAARALPAAHPRGRPRPRTTGDAEADDERYRRPSGDGRRSRTRA